MVPLVRKRFARLSYCKASLSRVLLPASSGALTRLSVAARESVRASPLAQPTVEGRTSRPCEAEAAVLAWWAL